MEETVSNKITIPRIICWVSKYFY